MSLEGVEVIGDLKGVGLGILELVEMEMERYLSSQQNKTGITDTAQGASISAMLRSAVVTSRGEVSRHCGFNAF